MERRKKFLSMALVLLGLICTVNAGGGKKLPAGFGKTITPATTDVATHLRDVQATLDDVGLHVAKLKDLNRVSAEKSLKTAEVLARAAEVRAMYADLLVDSDDEDDGGGAAAGPSSAELAAIAAAQELRLAKEAAALEQARREAQQLADEQAKRTARAEQANLSDLKARAELIDLMRAQEERDAQRESDARLAEMARVGKELAILQREQKEKKAFNAKRARDAQLAEMARVAEELAILQREQREREQEARLQVSQRARGRWKTAFDGVSDKIKADRLADAMAESDLEQEVDEQLRADAVQAEELAQLKAAQAERQRQAEVLAKLDAEAAAFELETTRVLQEQKEAEIARGLRRVKRDLAKRQKNEVPIEEDIEEDINPEELTPEDEALLSKLGMSVPPVSADIEGLDAVLKNRRKQFYEPVDSTTESDDELAEIVRRGSGNDGGLVGGLTDWFGRQMGWGETPQVDAAVSVDIEDEDDDPDALRSKLIQSLRETLEVLEDGPDRRALEAQLRAFEAGEEDPSRIASDETIYGEVGGHEPVGGELTEEELAMIRAAQEEERMAKHRQLQADVAAIQSDYALREREESEPIEFVPKDVDLNLEGQMNIALNGMDEIRAQADAQVAALYRTVEGGATRKAVEGSLAASQRLYDYLRTQLAAESALLAEYQRRAHLNSLTLTGDLGTTATLMRERNAQFALEQLQKAITAGGVRPAREVPAFANLLYEDGEEDVLDEGGSLEDDLAALKRQQSWRGRLKNQMRPKPQGLKDIIDSPPTPGKLVLDSIPESGLEELAADVAAVRQEQLARDLAATADAQLERDVAGVADAQAVARGGDELVDVPLHSDDEDRLAAETVALLGEQAEREAGREKPASGWGRFKFWKRGDAK